VRPTLSRLAFTTVAMAAVLFSARTARACPFCDAQGKTMTEQMDMVDVVALAKLVSAPELPKLGDPDSVGGEPEKAKFEIIKVLKGEKWLGKKRTVEAFYYEKQNVGKTFMVEAASPPELVWGAPLLMSEAARQYVQDLQKLPKKTSQERLRFFIDYLEHKDEMLARDAYDEFARTPYDIVKQLKDQYPHDKLVAWIQDRDVPDSRRRLYLTLLGVGGVPSSVKRICAPGVTVVSAIGCGAS